MKNKIENMFENAEDIITLLSGYGKGIKDFKQMMFYLYGYFPSNRISQSIFDKIVVNEELRQALVAQNYLIEEKIKPSKNKPKLRYYSLGPNGLALVSAWETEDLSKRMEKLTVIMLIMTIVAILLAIIQVIPIFSN